MADIVGRLLPSVREIRNPLAVGATWLVLLWTIADVRGLDAEQTAVELLFRRLLADVPDVAGVAAFAFVATLLGSGLVRLMDRLMQWLRRQHMENAYSPLDRADSLRRSGAGEFRPLVKHFVENNPDLDRWNYEEDGPGFKHNVDLYLRSLPDDSEFAALQSEQLLRFSMVFPLLVGAVASTSWAFGGEDSSVAWLALGLWVFSVAVVLDYKRTGTLMHRRWTRLVDEFPDWLPKDVRGERERHFASRSAEVSVGAASNTGPYVENSGRAVAKRVVLQISHADSHRLKDLIECPAIEELQAGRSIGLDPPELELNVGSISGVVSWSDGTGSHTKSFQTDVKPDWD